MKIVNNKIYIGRGETPTYDVFAIDEETGAPFIIPAGVKKPVLEFIVRPSIYDREDDYVFRTYLDFSDFKRFSDETIVDYTGSNGWDNANPPSDENKNKLFRLKVAEKLYEYRYYDESIFDDNTDSRWIPYNFEIKFQFPYDSTSKMEAKTYKYEIALFDADIVYNDDGKATGLDNIIFKKFLRNATDFIVDGSLSE